MEHRRANQIADLLGGEPQQIESEAHGEDNWVVLIERPDGRIVVVSARSVDEYADRDALEDSACYASISLT